MADVDHASLIALRLGHLGMIQGVVDRLAGQSATVKNFCLTLVAGAIALAFSNHLSSPLWIALAAPLLFVGLDAYYLGLERAFRTLYEEVAGRDLSEAGQLSMKQRPSGTISALRSPAILPFYLPQIIVAALLIWKVQP
jgi:hypothetical protein